MHARFQLPHYGHNSKLSASGKGIRNVASTFPSDRGKIYIDMTMKHPRGNERVDSPVVLLGSDHSKKKRQRTVSEASESRAIEFSGYISNGSAKANNISNTTNGTNGAFSQSSKTYSPRMMALLSSLEALDDQEQRQIHPQQTINSSQAPPSTPLSISSSTNQAAATLLLQKQRYPKVAKPLTARPQIHKIEEHPPTAVSGSQFNTNSLHSITTTNVGSGDALNESPTIDTSALDTITRAVAAATSVSTSEDTASSLTLEQHGTAGTTPLTVLAAQSGGAFSHVPTVASKTIGIHNASLIPYIFPNNPSTATTTKYDAANLNHTNTSRQLAIHNAIHNDYKKIYKPLRKPPRLPTPHEALGFAAISTVTPATSTCR